MKLPDFKSILGIPFVYSFAQKLIRGKGNYLFVKRYVKPVSGDSILDIGCGPGDILTELPMVNYVGFDIDPRLIEAARRKYGATGRFFCSHIHEDSISSLGEFDLVLATGVIHHLSDEEALSLLRLARKTMTLGGRLITWDCCFLKDQSAFSRFLMARDRGKFVRTRPGYEHLASQVFSSVKSTIDHDLVRIPYPSIIMECGPQ